MIIWHGVLYKIGELYTPRLCNEELVPVYDWNGRIIDYVKGNLKVFSLVGISSCDNERNMPIIILKDKNGYDHILDVNEFSANFIKIFEASNV